ncbi:MAG: deoxynucleoside kinase [Bacteroidota bacterium]|nr:deoxynucleoside kinase [Bacteroidota bacterium]
MHPFICIEGNIGTGKTELAKMIAKDFGKKLVLEEFDDNPFLPKFYKQPKTYAFPLEMSFLASRFNQFKKEISQADLFQNGWISDYIFFKCLIFSKINLNDDEYELYTKMFEIINIQLPKPDLLVYLHKPIDKLLSNIKKRNRDYEQGISEEYLYKIQKGYFDFLYQLPDQKILMINTEDIDFINKRGDYELMVELINKEYNNGLTIINNIPG